jgi:hypothetical protein
MKRFGSAPGSLKNAVFSLNLIAAPGATLESILFTTPRAGEYQAGLADSRGGAIAPGPLWHQSEGEQPRRWRPGDHFLRNSLPGALMMTHWRFWSGTRLRGIEWMF